MLYISIFFQCLLTPYIKHPALHLYTPSTSSNFIYHYTVVVRGPYGENKHLMNRILRRQQWQPSFFFFNHGIYLEVDIIHNWTGFCLPNDCVWLTISMFFFLIKYLFSSLLHLSVADPVATLQPLPAYVDSRDASMAFSRWVLRSGVRLGDQ